MSLYKRLKRWRGYDTTITTTHKTPVYDYTVEHIDGEYSNIVAHGYNIDGAFARFYEYTQTSVWQLGGYRATATGRNEKRVLESIREIEKERVGTTEFRAVVDTADGTVCETTVNTESEL